MALTGLATSAYRFGLGGLIWTVRSRSDGQKSRFLYLAGAGHRRRARRRRCGSAVDGAVVLEVLELGEGNDGVKRDTSETLVQVASSISTWNDGEVRPEFLVAPTTFRARMEASILVVLGLRGVDEEVRPDEAENMASRCVRTLDGSDVLGSTDRVI